MENILDWVQVYAEMNNFQVNSKVITNAVMDAIDALDIKVDCSCPDFCYRFAYMATKMGYKYGKPETRPAKITNPNDYGSMCKHLISMLSNKKWLRQVAGTFMDYFVKRIDEINRFLRVKPGEELTLPDETARQRAKQGAYTKWADRVERLKEVTQEYIDERKEFILESDIFHIMDDLKSWLDENYKNTELGIDYLKLTKQELDVMKQEIENFKQDNIKQADTNNKDNKDNKEEN